MSEITVTERYLDSLEYRAEKAERERDEARSALACIRHEVEIAIQYTTARGMVVCHAPALVGCPMSALKAIDRWARVPEGEK